MKTTIISYSHTGRNKALAENLTKKLSAKHITLEEAKKRSNLTIVLDLIFNRTPKIKFDLKHVKDTDFLILVGPVWMGKVAFPFRALLKNLKNTSYKYVFVSLSGGEQGNAKANPNLEKELTDRAGKKPIKVINLYVADFLPKDPKPELKDIFKYNVTEEDIEKVSKKVIEKLSPYYAQVQS